MAKRKRRMKSGDFILVLITLGLVIFGIIMVFSASYYTSINKSGNPYSYLIKDTVWAMLGLGAMLVTATVDYRFYSKIAKPVMIISVILLVLLFTPLGEERNYATRWLGVGGITIMPGELAKPAAIIFTSWFLSRDPKIIKSLTKGVVPLFVLCGVYGGLIILQPNLSTAITVCIIIIGIMFAAGLNYIYLGGLVGVGALGICTLIITNPDSHWMKRLTSFMDPFADPLNTGYQVVQSLLALGSGGLFGLGLGKSIQKNLYLPEPQNDFIFAIIGEELGFVGCLILIIAYIILVWRGIHIAINAADLFGTLLASGISVMIGIQVILNIAVVTSSMPPTGVTLPFVSYGGNALLIFMASVGILLNISRHSVAVE
ncbi:MAG: putative lipid II flippase FtsW [Clostridiales bacterium]|nr:putative lipid II flippase FtsW [Aminipila sp.]MBE6035183.1 putative lipid II flippase FtsW [Clostridiales bacterium]